MQVRWLPEAASDLAAIDPYLGLHLPPFRQSTMIQIYEGICALGEMPYRGRVGRAPGTRELVFARLPYIATYRIHHDAVEVLYVRHAAQEQGPSRQ